MYGVAERRLEVWTFLRLEIHWLCGVRPNASFCVGDWCARALGPQGVDEMHL